MHAQSIPEPHLTAQSQTRPAAASPALLIVNADDWGRSSEVTGRILECMLAGVVSSTSAMVFMQDSERAASLAHEHNLDIGLHLNLTGSFTGPNISPALQKHQDRVSRFLSSHRYAPVIFHPLLVLSFEYLVKAQIEEYERLYGVKPSRIDGHHHMHLSANVQWQKLLPERTILRRNFSFTVGEKGLLNRAYRALQDGMVRQRHRTADLFFDLVPMHPERLKTVLEAARQACVEIETHPSNPDEFNFLMSGELQGLAPNVEIVRGYHLRLPVPPMAAQNAPSRMPRIEIAAPVPHITVGICTYKRPGPLMRLLNALGRQKTGGAFTYSIVVVDNDADESARPTAEAMADSLPVPLKYSVQPLRSIARTRNAVVAAATGDYLAFIDDDEFPEADWLLQLLRTSQRYDVHGVLGPVKRHFDREPPPWLSRSSLYDRPVNPTGLEVRWREARTGNVLLPMAILVQDAEPFRPELVAGEDQDFFRRKIDEGMRFVWCADAVVHEVLPEARWKRGYYMRKALMHGGNAALRPDCNAKSITKSLIAVPLYTLSLPLAALAGQHRFMTLLVKLCDHTGKLLALMGLNPIREEYVSE